MACIRMTLRSRALDMDTIVNVVIPYDYFDRNGNPGKFSRTLYLLHGLRQNADAWQRLSSAERYANYYGYALVMPDAQRSFYTDMAHGPRFFTYLTEELPRILHGMFKIPDDPAHTYVGGLSMGGYGALKCALQRPDRYAGAICLSSGFFTLNRPELLMNSGYYGREELQGVIGCDMQASAPDDLTERIRNWPKDQKKPLLYMACGTEDPLHPLSAEMHALLAEHNFDIRYEEWPGIHDWRFWDVGLEKGMVYMRDRDEAAGSAE